jgi:predicted metalloenzyme YecM
MYQYRITVNGCESDIMETYPKEQWEKIALVSDNREINAKFERRLITDITMPELMMDIKGLMRIGEKVIFPWDTIAEIITR